MHDGSSKGDILFLELVFGVAVPMAAIVFIFWHDTPRQDLHGLSTIPSYGLYDLGSTSIGFVLRITSAGFVPLLIPFSIVIFSAFSLLIHIIFRSINPLIGGFIISGNIIYIAFWVTSICFAFISILLISSSGCRWFAAGDCERFSCDYFLIIILICLLPIAQTFIIFFRSAKIYAECIKKFRSKTAVFGVFLGGFLISIMASIVFNSIVKIYAERELDRLINLSIGKNQVQVIELTNPTWLRRPLSWAIDLGAIIEKRYIESGRDHGIGQLYRVLLGLKQASQIGPNRATVKKCAAGRGPITLEERHEALIASGVLAGNLTMNWRIRGFVISGPSEMEAPCE